MCYAMMIRTSSGYHIDQNGSQCIVREVGREIISVDHGDKCTSPLFQNPLPEDAHRDYSLLSILNFTLHL
jgi:hypothetical protein